MTPSGIEPATFRFVGQRLNHCASAVPTVKQYITFIPTQVEQSWASSRQKKNSRKIQKPAAWRFYCIVYNTAYHDCICTVHVVSSLPRDTTTSCPQHQQEHAHPGRSSSTNRSKQYGKHNRTFAVQMAWLFVNKIQYLYFYILILLA